MTAATDSAAVVLSGDHISFARAELQILTDVSFTLHAGELVTLLGPNGAGKSTLLGILLGDLTPNSGTVRLDGEPLDAYPGSERARRIALLSQRHEVAFGFRVDEVVAMGRAPWRRIASAADDLAAVSTALNCTETAALADREATHLSGGESARVGLARTLAQDTPIIALDEPAAAMDISHRERTHALLRRLADAGCAVLVVGHDLDAAAAWSDRVVLLDRGRVVAAGSPREVLTAAILEPVYRTRIDVFDHPLDGSLIVRPARRPAEACGVGQMPTAAARAAADVGAVG